MTGRTLLGIILTYKFNMSLSTGNCTIVPNGKSFSSCEFSDHLFALPCTDTWTKTIKRRLLCDIVGRKWKSLLQLYFSTAKHGRAAGRVQQKGEHENGQDFWRVLLNIDPSHTINSKPEPLKQLSYYYPLISLMSKVLCNLENKSAFISNWRMLPATG